MRWAVEYRAIIHGVCRDWRNPENVNTYASKPLDYERVIEVTPDEWIEDLRLRRESMIAAPHEALAAVAPYTDVMVEEVLEIYELHALDAEARAAQKKLNLVFELMMPTPEFRLAN